MGQKVLLIDDSAILRRIAAGVLGARPHCFEVISATRATEGFARACSSSADVILVDFQIAGIPGADFCRRLLTDPRTARTPVVLLLGRGMEAPALEKFPDNVVATLSKPFTPEQLSKTVCAVADLGKSGPGLARIRGALNPQPPVNGAAADKKPPAEAATVRPAAFGGARPTRVSPAPVRSPSNLVDVPPRKATVRIGTRPVKPTGGDGPLIFQSDTATTSVRAAMHAVAEEKLSGILRFRPAKCPPLEVFTDRGHFVVVSSRDASAYSAGAAEALPPKVSPATLEAAVADQTASGIPFFLTLGARGLLSKAAATALLHRYGQRHFARLWALSAASIPFEFEPLEALPGFALRLEPERECVDEWLLGTLRHLEPGDVAEIFRHEGGVGTPSYRRDGLPIIQSLKLNDAERDFSRHVNGRNDLPSIAKASGISLENAFLMLYRFRCLEIMDYRPAPAAFVVTPRTNVRRVLPLHR